jgi:hypothetical protein
LRRSFPRGYEALLKDDAFFAHVQGFYQSRLQELQKLKEAEGNPLPQAEAFPGHREG